MEVTSLEQSKELLNAGLSRESVDLWWVERYVAEWVGNDEEGRAFEHHVEPVTYLSFVNEGMHNTSNDKVVVTPAWSLGKLLGMFKDKIFELNVYNKMWSASSGFLIEQEEHWVCQEFDETPIGAVVKLILKLKLIEKVAEKGAEKRED